MKRQNPTMFFHLIFLLVIIPLKAEGARTCLEQAQLAGVVFGTSLATVVLIIFVAYLLLYVYKRRLKGDQDGVLEKVRDPEKSAYENPTCETEEKGTDPMVIPREDKMTNCHSLRQRNRRQNIQLFRHHRSKSSDSITTLKDMFRTLMEDRDINGLGFTICGSQNEGIFVANVHPKGPAGRCGNILSGDRIKGVSISFDSMVFEDALTILSAASLYKVKLELERQVSDEMDSVSVDKQATLERPLYQRAPQPERPPTIMSESILSFTSTESARPDSPPSSIAISLTDVSSATIPASVLNGSSPVPPQCPSTPPPPPLVNCTPQKSLKTRQSPSKPISDFVEVSRYEYCKPRIDTKRAGRIEFCEKLEPKRISMVAEWSEPKANSSDDETLIQAKNTTKVMIEPETIVIRDENKPQEVKSVIIPPAPVITDIRVMKEAAESPLKTPIVERKLPPLPKTLSIPVEEENEGGKLYIEKKESLRSTFDVINNDQSEISDLDAKHRALLDKNRNILKRQQEELKALGVIL